MKEGLVVHKCSMDIHLELNSCKKPQRKVFDYPDHLQCEDYFESRLTNEDDTCVGNPFSKLLYHANGMSLSLNIFNMHQPVCSWRGLQYSPTVRDFKRKTTMALSTQATI
ncbi:hypothetical protein TNCV_2452071 [Trichonephila clavipes]|nr:hypothetical protein TNCV_2452071 [Trichonephila clavipes]